MLMSLTEVVKLSFGDWLRLKRNRLGISQGDIAQQLNVKTQTISNWEKGRSIPSLNPEQTNTLCAILNVDLATLAKAFREEFEIDG